MRVEQLGRRAWIGVFAAIVFAVAGGSIAHGDYVSAVTAQEPMFYWRLNEAPGATVVAAEVINVEGATSSGIIGSEVGLQQTGDPALTPAGGFPGLDSGNSWFFFPGVVASDFIQHLTTPRNIQSSAIGSVSHWVKTTTGRSGHATLPTHYGTLYRADQSATGALLTFFDEQGKFGLRITNDSETITLADVRTASSYNNGQWHHVAATWDETAGTATIYVNGGVLAGGETVIGTYTSGNPFVSSNRHAFGKGAVNNTLYNGFADELAIWNRVLSDREVATQYFNAAKFPGDANADGKVDIADLSVLASNWQQTDRWWMEGDFNGDGLVNIADLSLLASNWQMGVTGSPSMSFAEALAMFDAFNGVVIPEPAGVAMLMLSTVLLARRRR